MNTIRFVAAVSILVLSSLFYSASNVCADPVTSTHSLRIVAPYKGTFTSPPTQTNTQFTTDAPLMGNGDLGVAVFGKIDAMTFSLGKNEFWSLADRTVKAMARLNLSIPDMANASYSMTQDIAVAEVNGTFSLGGNTITTKSWVNGDNATVNRLITQLKYTGTGTRNVAVSIAVGMENNYIKTPGSTGDVLFLDVGADNADSVKGYATRKVRVATRVIGTTGTVSNNTLTFTLSPGTTYSLVTCIMSNYDSIAYETAAVSSIASETAAGVDLLLSSHHTWWNNFYSKSFVEIPNKLLEKEFYGSLYLFACASRANEAPPGLYANWVMKNPGWFSDYTCNYNFEAPFYMTFPTNHTELSENFDKPVIDWVPNAQALAKLRGFTGAYYRVHIGPLPDGTADENEWNQKSMGAFVTTIMTMYYYYTRDTAYARKIYPAYKQIAIFYQDYLKLDPTNTRYMMYNDAQHEGNAYPQTNGVMSLGLIRFFLQACIDISTELNVDPDFRAIWQDRISKLSPYPLQVRNGQTVFRYTEVGLDWNGGNVIGTQHIFPSSQFGLETDSAQLAIAKNMVDQMQRWNDGCGTNTFYPAAVRVGYDPNSILSHLNSFVAGSTYPNLHIHTGGGGIENVTPVPITICEMFVQSFQNKIRLFANWPANTFGKFGDLLAYGNFLISSDIESNGVQYVRVISNKGRPFTFYNPWSGQTLRIYRNGIDSGTVSGKLITINTSVNEVIHLAANGTSYGAILDRMKNPAGTIAGVANGSRPQRSDVSFSVAKRRFSRAHDRAIAFSAISTKNDNKKMTVDIYSLDGTLVKEVVSYGNVVGWDLKGNGTLLVSAGVYTYRITLERDDKTTMASGMFLLVQ
jgi:hypothetical protein